MLKIEKTDWGVMRRLFKRELYNFIDKNVMKQDIRIDCEDLEGVKLNAEIIIDIMDSKFN